jgi:hypothetical protein
MRRAGFAAPPPGGLREPPILVKRGVRGRQRLDIDHRVAHVLG